MSSKLCLASEFSRLRRKERERESFVWICFVSDAVAYTDGWSLSSRSFGLHSLFWSTQMDLQIKKEDFLVLRAANKSR